MPYALMAVISSLLPGVLLFIPNPYMPMDIAMAHFIETSVSNFLWGLIIVYAINRLTSKGVLGIRQRRLSDVIAMKQP